MANVIFTRLLMVVCFLVFMGTHLVGAVSAQDLKTQNDKESYSIGYEVGLSMRSDGVEVNLEKIVQGLTDALNRKEPLLESQEMRKLVADLKKRTREAQLRKVQELMVSNAQESEKFLEENKKKKGIKTTESGLQYRVVKKGGGTSPKPDDMVKVAYRGTFVNGEEFDSSYKKGEPVLVKADSVIKGWTEALPMMKVGSRWQLYVPPNLAYGRVGLGQRIPPNKVLIFDMELLAIEKKAEAEKPQARTGGSQTVRKMKVMGQIGKTEQGYVIRSMKGSVLSEIYTVLNPDPKVLDTFVKNEKTIPIAIHIVSGDNVNIEKIDDEEYGPITP